jgi:hypothetical protein
MLATGSSSLISSSGIAFDAAVVRAARPIKKRRYGN